MKKVWKSLFLFIAVVGLGIPSAAEQPMVQRRVNVQIRSQDFRDTAAKLNRLLSAHGGTVTNLNIDIHSTSGNANFKLPPDQVDAFLEELPQLGDLANLSESSSDNARSYEDTLRRLESYEKLAQADLNKLFAGMKLSPEEELAARAELTSYLRDRINSHRSSLDQYRDYGRSVEFSLSLQQPPQADEPAQSTPPAPGPHAEPPQEFPGALLLPVYLLLGINLLGLLALSRRLKS